MTEFMFDDLKLFEGHRYPSTFFTPSEQLLLLENKLHKITFSKVN